MKTLNRRISSIAVAAIVIATALTWVHHGYADAPPGRYIVGNGTVFDTMTKLTWQQGASGLGLLPWSQAASYCNTLSLDGGGWRLPSSKELQTTIDENGYNPTIDPTFAATSGYIYWSSTQLPDTKMVMAVHYEWGYTSSWDPASYDANVRCVR